MCMLSHPLRSGFLFPLSRLPPLPRCPPPPCLLHSPSSLLVWLPRFVWLCCSSPCPLALLSHPPAPPHDVDCPVRDWRVTPLLPHPWRAPPSAWGAAPALVEFVGTSWREGGAWLLMACSASAAFSGWCGARTPWSPCVLLCVLLGLVSPLCVGWPCSQLLGCVRSSQFGAPFSSAGALTAAGVRCRGSSVSLPASRCSCRDVPLSFGWHQGHLALLHISPNLQTDLSLVFVGVVLW